MFKKLVKFNVYLFATLAIRKLIKQLLVGYKYSKMMRAEAEKENVTFFKAFNELGMTDLEIIYALQRAEEGK
ncbi:hypothetical protein [Staphylococcus nepalensis]|uniref:hypothetical protein n=1 Tax=Staphylococcus nepalensis TaxID=214473 RepID=UPI000E006E60|nr:hypothetical protein [Staphylococcus nepalensis]SUM66738.1 Uncharacterised protein [Staphylococcus nepalensis]SUM94675.1 Uncharacterised protein [Staphylococcus nepalensis]